MKKSKAAFPKPAWVWKRLQEKLKKTGVLFLLFVLFACKDRETAGIVPASQTAPPAAAVQREAVLTRNNGWVTGVPGFAGNAFPALSGEYRLEGPDLPKTGEGGSPGAAVFSVHASRAPLFFSDIWQRRPETGDKTIFQRFRGNDLLAALVLEVGPVQGLWTVVFEFPGGTADMGLENAGFIRLIEAWSSRFIYFASLIKTPGDASLPAVVVF
jgi:hypothetical protein